MAKTHLGAELVDGTRVRRELGEAQDELGKRDSKNGAGVEVSAEDEGTKRGLRRCLDGLEVRLGRGRVDRLGGVGSIGENAGRGGRRRLRSLNLSDGRFGLCGVEEALLGRKDGDLSDDLADLHHGLLDVVDGRAEL